MISKKTFIKVLKLIKEQAKINSKVGEALELVCDSWVMYGFKDKNSEALYLVLQELLDPTSDWIGWWLWEDVEKVVTYEDGGKIKLDTAGQLYDFLINNFEKN